MGPVFLAFAAVITFGDPTSIPPVVRTPPIAHAPLVGWAPLPVKPPSRGSSRFDELAMLVHSTSPIVPSEEYAPPIWRAAEGVERVDWFGPSYDYARVWGCSF